MNELMKTVPGAQELFDWLGRWPFFHDSEVLSIELNRRGPSRIRVHAFRMTDKMSPSNHYTCDKHCIVTFWLDDLIELDLVDFNNQNALNGLDVKDENGAFVMTFRAAHGVEGFIKSKKLSIETLPGIPEDSQYLKL